MTGLKKNGPYKQVVQKWDTAALRQTANTLDLVHILMSYSISEML